MSEPTTPNKWTADTVVTMLNVPWNNDYRDVFRFADQAALDSWIDDQVNITIPKFSLAKFNHDIIVDMPINRAMKFNYLRADNGIDPDDISRNYYYFVLGVEWMSGRATKLTLQLDVFQTFGYEVVFGRSFLERGHMGIANTNQFDQYGRSYLTVPEGLDAGSEYRIVHKEHEKIIDPGGVIDADPGYDVLVVSTLDLTQDPGTIADPSLNTSTGGNFQGLPSGADFYIFPTGLDLQKFFTAYTDKPWITESIISITIIPNQKRYNPDFDYGTNLGGSAFNMYKMTGPFFKTPPVPHTVKNLTNWRNADFIGNILGNEYKNLKKFFTYPYMFVELTTFTGSPLILRPESWQDPDAKVTELASFMPPGQRIGIYPSRYNADAETAPTDSTHLGSVTQTDNVTTNVFDSSGNPTLTLIDDNGESLDMAAFLDNFPSLPVVNNMAMSYLASNKNGIAFSFQNAEWGRTRARAGAQAGADVANSQIGNTARQSSIAMQNATQQAAISTNARMVGSGVNAAGALIGGSSSGLGPKGVARAATDIAGAGINSSAELEALNANNAARGQSAVSDVQTAGQVRDTNQGFANFAAQGDYENAIAGIGAKNQDAMLTQPSVSGQFGGDAFNIINGLFGYALVWKMLNLNALRMIGNHWLRYGYAVHQFIVPPANMQCMTKFTYWKLAETRLSQAFIPEGFKQIIRGIFEKGVTVWHDDPFDIGNLPLDDNEPIAGISY